MGKLTDVIAASGCSAEEFSDLWDQSTRKTEFDRIPQGEYVCRTISSDLGVNDNGTPRYQVAFEVIEGSGGDLTYANRRLWRPYYLTPDALPGTYRELKKLEIDGPAKLERPLPRGILCRTKVSIRSYNNGVPYNHVILLEVLGVEKPTIDPFAPIEQLLDGQEGSGT